jgi:hypothetical protein
VSSNFPAGSFWKSSTEPREEREVEEGEAVGESSGLPAVELEEEERPDSTVPVRLMAAGCDLAVVLIAFA